MSIVLRHINCRVITAITDTSDLPIIRCISPLFDCEKPKEQVRGCFNQHCFKVKRGKKDG